MQNVAVIPFTQTPRDGQRFPRTGHRPELIAEGNPIEYGEVFFRDAGRRFMTGVWDCDPGTFEFESYPVDEICFVLEGSIVLTTGDGVRQAFGPGQGFMIRKGSKLRWEMPTGTKKYYVVLKLPEEAAPA